LEPENRGKERLLSPRKVLGAREQGKRAFAVAKKDSWSPRTVEKSVCGRQERFLEPVNSGKERLRSPRKVLGAREQGKRAFAVAKKFFCARQQRKSSKKGTKIHPSTNQSKINK
jgi:hypothetical protein